MKVAIIFQTNTAESQVAQNTATNVMLSLNELGIESVKIPFSANIIEDLNTTKPTVVFNAMHGKYGEDGYLPSILNAMKIPYTHSGVFASQIGMNKILTDIFAQQCNINTIPTQTILKNNLQTFVAKEKCVIKPMSGGSSVATFVLEKGQSLSKSQFNEVQNYNEGSIFLVQKFIQGKEVCVAILNNKSLGTIEIKPAEEFYTYSAKYQSKETQYIMPAEISEDVSKNILQMAENLHNTINVSCVSRVDFIITEHSVYLLEINTHPGLTQTSLLPKIAMQSGISYPNLIQILLQNAQFEDIL